MSSVRGDTLSAFIAAEKLMNPAHVDVLYKPNDRNTDYSDRIDCRRSTAALSDGEATPIDSSSVRNSMKASKGFDQRDIDDTADKNR